MAELRNAVETILSGVRESVLAMRERAADDRGHYDDMFSAVHRRFDRVEARLDEIDRRRPTIGFGGGPEAGPGSGAGRTLRRGRERRDLYPLGQRRVSR